MLSTKLARGGLLAPRLSSTCLPAVQTMATMKPLSKSQLVFTGLFALFPSPSIRIITA